MPASARSSVASETQRTARSSEYQQHRREKTRSTPSYSQRHAGTSRESSTASSFSTHVPASGPSSRTTTVGGDKYHSSSRAQHRPSKGRAHSAPLGLKSHLPTPPTNVRNSAGAATAAAQRKIVNAANQDEEEEEEEEEEEGEEFSDESDEEIADDPFFQRYDSIPTATKPHEHLRIRTHAHSRGMPDEDESPLSPTSKIARARPDSTADPLRSPLSPQSTTASWPENSARLQEINIVVLGSQKVGKSAFIQRAFNLKEPPLSRISSRKMSIDGNVYVVQLIELSFGDVDLDDESRICWPDTVQSQPMPYIDGAFALYDVTNKDSLARVTETLNGIYNASIPFILVACKCDCPAAHRLIDPSVVEKRAKALIGDITAFQTSKAQPDSQKRCVAVLLRAIVCMRNQHIALAAAARRRANSSAVTRVSPKASSFKHNRANSEFSGSMHRSQHSASSYTSTTSGQLATRSKSAANLPMLSQQPHMIVRETGYHSEDAERYSSDEESRSPDAEKPLPALGEVGYSFDQLVDKLLAQPMTKNDQKFAAVFLALYRNFCAPSRLLAAIIDRFDMLRAQQIPALTRIAAQQRHLHILEQWIGMYPGDFAFPKTLKTMEAFVYRISFERIFAVDAREIAADLENVAEDDDTNWAFCDSVRDRSKYDSGNGLSKSLAALSVLDDTPPGLTTLRSPSSVSSASTSQTLLNVVENAQRAAKLLVPTPRTPLTKVQWHALMELSDDIIAKELTRMDSIMFTSIRPRDLVRYVSLAADAKKRCRNLENVHRMIEHFNHIADWVINFVLLRDKPKHRALMLEKFYKIARELRKLNNYNSLAAVVSGINNSAIYRLQATKDLIPADSAKDFKRLEVLMSPQKSYAAYRLAWENTSGERIPYLPLHKRDLVSASEGNRTFVNEDDGKKQQQEELQSPGGSADPALRINWKKFEITGEVIVSVQRAQGTPYAPVKANGEVGRLVCETEIVRDEETLYDRSCQVEPAGGGGARRRFQWFPAGVGGGTLSGPTTTTPQYHQQRFGLT